MAETLRVPEIDKTGKYLGIPSDWGASKKQMFAWILARVNMKMEGWKEKLLSKAGKEILIKTVIQALPQYAMSIFKIPLSVCRAIEQKIAAFWWKNQSTGHGIHWKNWESLKQRKDYGGLGFKDLISFNYSMLGKQAWRLAQFSNTLCAKLFKGIYFPNTDFWKAGKNSRPSWGWQSLLMGRKNIEQKTMWKVGDGLTINIREDKWLKSGVMGGPAREEEPVKVAELIHTGSRTWKEPMLREFYDDQRVEEILTIQIPAAPIKDSYIWTENRAGKFTVQSCYNNIRKQATMMNTSAPSSSYQASRNLWNRIWSMEVPHKVRNFTWCICQNALATKENLFRRKIAPTPICPICTKEVESVEHLLFFCPWLKEIWSHPKLKIDVSRKAIPRTDRWLEEKILGSDTLPSLELIAVTFWLIWKRRNGRVFNNNPMDPHAILEEGERLLRNFSKCKPTKRKSEVVSAKVQDMGDEGTKNELLVNIDAAFSPGSFEGSIGCICRSSLGIIVDGFVKTVKTASAEQTETLALVEALKFLSPRVDTRMLLKSDCLNLIKSLKSADHRAWEAEALISEANGLLHNFSGLTIAYCNRTENRIVDWIVKAHQKNTLPAKWLLHPPLILRDLLCSEAPLVGSKYFLYE